MHASEVTPPRSHLCGGCGLSFPLSVLSCPRCHRLTHAELLKSLSETAQRHTGANEPEQALTTWRDVLALLPRGTAQHKQVAARIQTLTQRTPANPTDHDPKEKSLANRAGRGSKGAWAGLGAVGLLLWKLKAVLAFALTKGKVLLLGLTKASTVLSMLLSLGVYWTLWGWQFAAGLVASIYVHEMGHVVALRRLGIAATAPMFIPGLGAVVRTHQYPATAAEDADVGLAGPVWGLAAALGCVAGSVLLDSPFLAAIGRVGAWINLFNLLPIWQLDGSRGFRALHRNQRWMAVAVITALALMTGEGMLWLLLIVAAGRTLMEPGATAYNHRVLAVYAGLLVVLAWLSSMQVTAVLAGTPS